MRIRERINKKKVEGGGGGEEYESCKTIQRWQLFPQFLITQRTIVCALLSFREPCTLGGVLLDISTQKMRCLLNTQHPPPPPLSIPCLRRVYSQTMMRFCEFGVARNIYRLRLQKTEKLGLKFVPEMLPETKDFPNYCCCFYKAGDTDARDEMKCF